MGSPFSKCDYPVDCVMTLPSNVFHLSSSTSKRVLQITCKQGSLIKTLYEEIVAAERAVKATLQVGRVTDWVHIEDSATS